MHTPLMDLSFSPGPGHAVPGGRSRLLRRLALIFVVGLVTALPIASLNLARAHSPGDATLTALTVTGGGAAQTLSPTFSSTVYFYTVLVDNSVAQITIAGTPDGDGTVAYLDTDADSVTDGQQVNLPTPGGKRINVVVSHADSGTTTTQTYTVLVVREGTEETDRAALIELYNDTDGDNWTNNDNWGSSTGPLDDWDNVWTILGDLVTSLWLQDNNLNGTLPPELGNLTGLENLYLHTNQLTGQIPPALGNLPDLRELHLYNNQLTGQIPPELGNLPSLYKLHLYNNQLTGQIPPELGNLPRPSQLYLHTNQLSGEIPAKLGDLASLQYLYLYNNQLSGEIPAELGDLASLKTLSLYNNQLSGEIPGELGDLANLEKLYLSRNQLSGEIPDLSGLTSVQELGLWGNQLTEEIPDSLGLLANLKVLSLGINQLSGEIPDLSGLTNLEKLYLHTNQLTEEIPESLGNLANLKYLSLSRNQLSGKIPAALGKLTRMLDLYLNENQLTGEIPDLSRLGGLHYLDLHGNQLEGRIPDWLGNLTANLVRVHLHDNQFSGPIPDLSRVLPLRHLSLWGNQLDGTIPDWLGNLTKLEILYLSRNQLEGEIPASLGDLTKLKAVRFAGNTDADGNPSLTGCVPHGLRSLVAADDLSPGVPAQDFIAVDADGDGDTDDEGDIPGLNLPFCMLSALDLSDVTLEPSFAAGTETYTASVADRVGSTTVTATLADPNDTVSIRKGTATYANGAAVPLAVGSNEITIEVTPGDARLLKQTYTVRVQHPGSAETDRAALMALYNSLGGASWTDKANWEETGGAIGTWHGVTTNAAGRVTDLDLSSNNLRGTLPPELGNLTNLEILYLSRNQLEGEIPASLGNLTNLRIARFAGNTDADGNPSLTGCVPHGLRSLVAADDLSPGVPAQDFIAVDADGDGDTDDEGEGDIPGLNLPFCMLSALDLSDVTLVPSFASGTAAYTASVANSVGSTTVTATLADPNDTVSIRKGTAPYASGAAVPLAVGSNEITIEVTPGDARLLKQTYTVRVTRRSASRRPSGGGSTPPSRDAHGNSPAQATRIMPGTPAPWASSTTGQINTTRDVDYFTLTVPYAGVLMVETTGATDTVGTVWQEGVELGMADSGGARRNFRLSVAVEAGPVVIAVAGNGSRTGAYTLRTHLVVGYLENPGRDSFQSGIGVLSGWVCEAEKVELELNGIPQQAAYGTERLDTASVCGDTDNGFGLLFNWNLLRDGEHEVVALVDGVELGRATVTVTTLGQEFLRDVTGTCEVEDFPQAGETVTVVWQQNSQNFVIAGGSPPVGPPTGRTSALTGFLENPGHNSFQSGVRVLSGWVCEADTVELALGHLGRQEAGYGTERVDTLQDCGDTDNGFGLLFNWNRLGEGEHTVVALVDGVELGRATVTVTTVGAGAEAEFLRDVAGECVVEDFPMPGETVTLEWQQNSQNFVITDVE